jgi:hypothetical protein
MGETNKFNITKEVFEIIKQSKLNGKSSITRAEIIKKISKKGFKVTGNQVGQVLYQLQQKMVYKKPRIKKIVNGRECSYTIEDELWLWKKV